MSEALAKVISLVVHGKSAPSAEQLTAIQRYTMPDFDAADALYVRTFVVAHSGIDRDRETFDESLLADFARTLPGKGAYIKHPMSWEGDGGPAEGRWFEAELKRMTQDEARALLREPDLKFPPDRTDATLLFASAYFVRTDDNKSLLPKIDAGIAGDVSIGFNAARTERLKDNDGRELNAYRIFGPGEALEASLVWLGAQPGARAVKSAGRKPPESTVNEEQQKALQAERDELKQKLEAAHKAASAMETLRKSLGANAELLDAPESLADIVIAGKAHRDAVVADIVATERLLGIVGDTDEAAKAAAEIHAKAPTASLLALAKHYEPRKPTGSQLKGSNPNGKPPAAADDATTKAPGEFASVLMK